MKAETLLFFDLNYNHSPILLHSISEQLQNVNSEFLQGTSMCKSVEISLGKRKCWRINGRSNMFE